MNRPSSTGFIVGDDEWRKLREPDGAPTGRQLLWLNAAGCLDLVWPGQAQPVTKGEAAWAIDHAVRGSDDGSEPNVPSLGVSSPRPIKEMPQQRDERSGAGQGG